MANKTVKPSEDYYDFLPQRVQESDKLNINEKNVLATLCFYRLNYSIYATEHDGWFYISQKELEEGSNYSHMQLNRILLKLILKKIIERKSGTNHRCTHYKLHPKIDTLLPKVEGDFANDTLAIDDSKNVNDTLAVKTTVETPNDTLDKIRLDKTSQGKTSLIVLSTKSNDDIGKTLDGDFTKSSPVDIEKVIDDELKNVNTFQELSTVGKRLREFISKNNKQTVKDLLNRKFEEKAELIRASEKT